LAPALKAAPDAGVLVVAGEIAQARRNFAEAAALFEQAARLSPNSAAIRTELGIARLAQGDSRAIAELQAAAGMAGSGSRPDTFLIISQLERKQFDAALASIAAFEKKQGASPVIWNYRGAAWLGKQDVARARDSFEQALKLDPGYFAAAANLAQLDSQAGQPAAARQRFEGVLKADPKNLNAMLALADLALRAKDEAGYVGWLEKAAATQPQAIQPRVTLARYLVAKGDKAKALNVANEAIAAQPDSPAALDLLGTVQLAAGDAVNAQSTYRKLAERQSGQTGPIVKLATAQIVAKDLEGARKSLQNALRLQPDSLVALQMLGGVEIQTRRFDQALTIARQIQQQQPKSGQGHALEAQAHYALRNYPKALDAYERAFKLEPSGALLVQELQVYTAQGKPEIGERRILAWLTDHPKEFPLLGAVAESLLKRRQYASAADHYFTLLRQFPDNIAILNNLGWALAELGDKRAPDYAMKAYKLSPGNPLAADTLGWALLKTGEAAKSLEYFRQALQKSPDNPDIQYHHALALNLTGDSMRARNELKRLFASGLRFEGESDARALLNRLDTAPLSKP
ncbi:MAG: PEP-CTERM system TPR-repeat protein PrsT, partial [Thiobacillus sp.]|nr:PEP-CTERM system TPR-repeat protein PrsT [Thiobacillus sp.]